MAKAKAGPVTVRPLAPPAAADANLENFLYRPVAQLPKPPDFKPHARWVMPAEMTEWLHRTSADPEFRSYPLYPAQVKRWKGLYARGGFVHFMPDGALCFNPRGMLLNGRHRLTAGSEQDKPIGFWIMQDVPDEMSRHMDMGRKKSQKDLFFKMGRGAESQTGSAMRLAMRYEEFLRGLRGNGTGWLHWGTQQVDELFDVDDYLTRRGELADLHHSAQRIYTKTKLNLSALMVFRYFQQLAWPDGESVLEEFWLGLDTGAMPPLSPSLVLRAWSKESYEIGEHIQGRRELHLLLLFRQFALHAKREKSPPRPQWARGFPMAMPYHPKDPNGEAAVRNVLAELDALDAKNPARELIVAGRGSTTLI